MKHHNATLDLFGLLQLPVEDWKFEEQELEDVVDQLKSILLKMESKGGIQLSDADQSIGERYHSRWNKKIGVLPREKTYSI